MPAVIVNNTAQIRLTWALDGANTAVNVLHAIKQGVAPSISQANADALADAVYTRVLAASLTTFSSRMKITTVGIRDLDQPNLPEYLKNLTTPVGGDLAGASEILPLNVASCVTLRTAKAGPSYRGRVYLTGWGEGASSNGVMAQVAANESVALVQALQTALADAGFTMAVASRRLGVSNAVTSIVSRDLRWDTQRRRIVPGI